MKTVEFKGWGRFSTVQPFKSYGSTPETTTRTLVGPQ